jgi:hypothetical protein
MRIGSNPKGAGAVAAQFQSACGFATRV